MPAAISPDARIRLKPEQTSCPVDGEVVILNLANSSYYGLEAVGAEVWRLIQEPRTFAEIEASLMETYEVDTPQLRRDLQNLLHRLAEEGLIAIEAPAGEANS